jgi:hypothetical protein
MSARLGMILAVQDSQVAETQIAPPVAQCDLRPASLHGPSALRVDWKRRPKDPKRLNPGMEMAALGTRPTRETPRRRAMVSSSGPSCILAKRQKMAPKALKGFARRQNLRAVKFARMVAARTPHRGRAAFPIARAETSSGI